MSDGGNTSGGVSANRRGRHQHRGDGHGRAHRDVNAPEDFWRRRAHPRLLLEDKFRVFAFPGTFVHKKDGHIDIDKHPTHVWFENELMSLSWTDAEGGLTGTIDVSLGTPAERQKLSAVRSGWLVVCEWRPHVHANYREIWRMRLMEPVIATPSGVASFQLMDDLAYLRQSEDTFEYGKDKDHKDGMKLRHIVTDICTRYQQPVGKLAKLDDKIKQFNVKGSPYDAIAKVIQEARNLGGKARLILRSRRGRLEIVPLKPNKEALVLGPAILDATFTRSLLKDFATALRVRASIKKKDKDGKTTHKKIIVLVKAKAAIKRYGYIVKDIDAGQEIETDEQAHTFGQRHLHQMMKPNKEVSLTHPGVASVRRWDAMTVRLGDYGPDHIIFITEVTHDVTGGDYQMSITCGFQDPYINTTLEEELQKKCQKAKDRGHKQSDACKKLKKLRKNVAQHQDFQSFDWSGR